MNIKKLTLTSPEYPEILRVIPDPPPQLYVRGDTLDELLQRPRVAIVGSRKVTVYGERVTRQLARELAEQGIVIISGLAFGVDALAHQAALEAGGSCIGVLPCPIDSVVPVSNRPLAEAIVARGGVLVSEYASGEAPFVRNFIARNRIMSGLAQAVLVTEATVKSGSRHTAAFAIKQGRDVLAVPGHIDWAGSAGCHNLIKSGAGLVSETKDVLNALGLDSQQTKTRVIRGSNAHEQTVLDLISQGISEGEELLVRSKLSVSEFCQILTMLEIGSKIRPLGANHWAIY